MDAFTEFARECLGAPAASRNAREDARGIFRTLDSVISARTREVLRLRLIEEGRYWDVEANFGSALPMQLAEKTTQQLQGQMSAFDIQQVTQVGCSQLRMQFSNDWQLMARLAFRGDGYPVRLAQVNYLNGCEGLWTVCGGPASLSSFGLLVGASAVETFQGLSDSIVISTGEPPHG